MARMKDFSDTTSDIYNIPLDKLTIDPGFNVRNTGRPGLLAHIESLRDSILEAGFLRTRPLTVRISPDQESVSVIDGHCRLMAVRLAIEAGADIQNLPCVSEGKGMSDADRIMMMMTSNNGLPLEGIEQAEVIKRLISFGWSEGTIARKLGRTRQHVVSLLELAGAPEGVRVMVVQGQVSATEAVKAIRSNGGNATKMLQAALAGAKAAGKSKATPKHIAAASAVPLPRVLQRVTVPLSVAAAHVVEMAKGIELPPDLDRAITALAESLQ